MRVMKKDTEVKLYMQARHKGLSQRLAAARAGMSERTARKYERAGKLPSQMKRPHPATADRSLARAAWTGAGGDLCPAAHAGRARPIGFYLDERHGHYDCWR